MVVALISGMAALCFFGCKKEQKGPPPTIATISKDTIISPDILAKIKAAGFSTQGAIKVAKGYLVEGDIVLTDAYLNSPDAKPKTIITTGKGSHLATDQYSVTNPVSPANHYTYVTYKISAAGLSSGYVSALDEAILRYNNQYLDIRFTRITTGTADISLSTFYQVSSLEGQSGFPTGGVPYNSIALNTYWYGTNPTNIQFLASVIQHEMGHCIGMRHTDYADRSFSCGGAYSNEGAGTAGAVQIPGTPSGADAASWMLACNDGVSNRTFNANDIIALNYLFPYLPGINGAGGYDWYHGAGTGSGTITAKPGTLVHVGLSAYGPSTSVHTTSITVSGATLSGPMGNNLHVTNGSVTQTLTMPASGYVSWTGSYTEAVAGTGTGNIFVY